MSADALSDEQLIARVKRLCADNARLLADLLVDLIDIEERRLHLKEACSSMREFCKRRFGMSPNQAWRRVAAARLVCRVPVLLDYVRRGDVDLSTLLLIRNFVDASNADEMVRATRCRSKRQIQRFLESREPLQTRASRRSTTAPRAQQSSVLERLDAISDDLFLLEIAIRNKTRILIERTRHLLRKALPHASLAALVHRAFETLVETLESAIAHARVRVRGRREVKAGHIPIALRQEVFVRDGFQCTYVSPSGERCRATRNLEIDHIVPRARRGSDDIKNLRCACEAHNQHYAELAFGKAFIQERVREREKTRRSRRPTNAES
jgi:5-methylcytosine-specific restriction endonuclease McrA